MNERGDDRMRLDRRGDGALDVDECVDGGVREEVAENFETFLSAPHAGEPVVDESDAHRAQYTKKRPSVKTCAPEAIPLY